MGKAVTAIVIVFIILFGIWFFFLNRKGDRSLPGLSSPETERFLEVRETDPFKGQRNAPIPIIVVGSFECPACKQAHPVLDQVLALYSRDVKIVWKDLPENTGESFNAAVAARCAQRQAKFWEYHDRLFRKQDVDAEAKHYIDWAQDLGLLKEEFEKCLTGRSIRRLVDLSIEEALSVGIEHIPFFQINKDVKLEGVQTLATFRKVIDEILAKQTK